MTTENHTPTEPPLAETEGRLKAVFDGVSDGLVVMDLGTRRFVMVNQSFRTLTGYEADEMAGLGLVDLHPAASMAYITSWIERLAKGTDTIAPDIPVKRKDGSIVRCDVSGAPLTIAGRPCLMGSFRENAYRHRMENEIRLKTFVFDSALTANSIADTRGVIREVNPAFLNTWGFERMEDAIGRKVPEFLANEHEALAIIKALDATGAWAGEYTAKRADGTTFVASSQATVVRDEHGQIVGYQSSVLDITERKRDEEERVKLHGQLAQAQKMESVGRLAGGVAHDFNNMLGVIQGYADLLMEELSHDDPNRSIVTEIRNATLRSAELARQLLAFARKQTVTPRVLDLNAAVSNLLVMLRRLIGEDIAMEWIAGEALWPVRIDPSQVDQVLTNLCVNARDAISHGGRVRIETRNCALDAATSATIPDARPGDYVALRVSDTGCGMDAGVRAHLFEPFFTTKAFGRGTGLGLAMVYGIVSQNGGFISVSSAPGRGTSFCLYLPRHDGLIPAEGEPADAPDAPTPAATVLLVEDEPMLLEMCRRMLEGLGYRVLTAGTPAEAMRCALERKPEIELLVTDVVMPEMNGMELAARLLTHYPGLKRLFISGYAANVFAGDGLLDEGVCFLQKPFSRRALAEALRSALESP